MNVLKVDTNFNIELEFNVSPFHKRMFAWAIDFVLVMMYFFAAMKLLTLWERNQNFSENTAMDEWSIFLILLAPMSLYPLLTEIFMNGQSIGKKIMRIRVINETGGNATISQFLLRWMLRISELIVLIVMIAVALKDTKTLEVLIFFFLLLITDVLLVAILPKSQRIGDMAAGTILINTQSANSINETVFVEVEEAYVPKYPQVMQLRDKDLSTIKTIYNIAIKRNNYTLAQQTAEKIKQYLNIQSSENPIDFLNSLLKDYNYLSVQ